MTHIVGTKDIFHGALIIILFIYITH